MKQRIIHFMKTSHILILLALFLAACATETERQLSHADSVMEERPDSALTILDGIDRHSLNDTDLPYFALLYTQAQIKTDVPLDSDSLISIAYAKYGSDTRGDRGIRSNFYTGEVFFNQEQYREAMRYYLTAYEESKRLGNDYWRAKGAERISDLFFFAYNYDEAAKYAQEAAYLFKLVDRQRNHRYSLAQLANIMLNNGDYDPAYALLDSLRSLVEKSSPMDSAFLQYIRMPMIDALMKTGKIEAIKDDSFDYVNKESDAYEFLDASLLQSRVCQAKGNPEMMKDALDDMETLATSDEDKIRLFYARYENAKATGNSNLALSLVDSMLYYQNAVAEDILQESVTAAQRDFYSETALRHETRAHFLKWMLVLAVLVFFLLVTVVVVFFILRNKARHAELQARLGEFMSLKDQAGQHTHGMTSIQDILEEIGNQRESMSSHIQELESAKRQLEADHKTIVERLFKEKWNTLDTLCDQYYGLDNSELNDRNLVANIQKELKKIVSKKGLSEITDAVDTYMGGIVTGLRTQCGFLKEADINFLALLFAGFSVRAVCMFIGIKYPHFYVKKSRLIKRIEASDAPDKSLFLQKLK